MNRVLIGTITRHHPGPCRRIGVADPARRDDEPPTADDDFSSDPDAAVRYEGRL